MGIKISCKEASEICDKAQYKNASFTEKLKLNFHLMFCKICSAYTKQNGILTRIIGKKSKICSNHNFELQSDEKDKLKELLKKSSE